MTYATEPDLGPLTWVKNEIDLALARADESLGQAGSASDAAARVQFAQTHLHQARGALSIVGLDGLTQFTSSLDQLLGAMVRGERPVSAEATALARRALATIGNYLEELVHGTPDQPLRLLSLYEELASARGAGVVSPSELFFPDLSQRPKRSSSAKRRLGEDELQTQLRAHRAVFQRGLLQLLRSPNDKDGPATMLEAVTAVESLFGGSAAGVLWFAGQAFLQALVNGDLPALPEIKKLCSQLDAQLKRLSEAPTPPPERLVRELLYWTSQAPARTEQQQSARSLWQLDALIPEAGSVISTAPLAPLLKSLQNAMGATKHAWDEFSSGHAAALQGFETHLTELTSLASQLGRPNFEKLVGGVADFCRWLRKDPLKANDTVAIEVATALLLGEAALGRGTPEAGFAAQVADTLLRLGALTRGEAVQSAESSPTVETARRAQEKEATGQLCREILTSLATVEQVLDDYFRNQQKRAPLATLAKPLKQIEGALTLVGDADAITLVHESAATVARFAESTGTPAPGEFETLAHGLSALGFYVDALQRGPANLDRFLHPAEPAIADEEEAQEETIAEETAQPAAPEAEPVKEPTESDIWGQMDAISDEAEILEDEELTSDFAPLPPTGASSPEAATPTAAPSAPAPEIDAELLEIFIEEAHEVLATIGEHNALSRTSPNSEEHLTSIRRAFHTLKGSGRMVGLRDLGDAAWGLEQTLNRWLQLEWPISPALQNLIEEAYKAFSIWVEQLEAGGSLARDVSALLSEAERLRSDDTPVLEPAQIAPSQASESPGEAIATAEAEPATPEIGAHEFVLRETLPTEHEATAQAETEPESTPEAEQERDIVETSLEFAEFDLDEAPTRPSETSAPEEAAFLPEETALDSELSFDIDTEEPIKLFEETEFLLAEETAATTDPHSGVAEPVETPATEPKEKPVAVTESGEAEATPANVTGELTTADGGAPCQEVEQALELAQELASGAEDSFEPSSGLTLHFDTEPASSPEAQTEAEPEAEAILGTELVSEWDAAIEPKDTFEPGAEALPEVEAAPEIESESAAEETIDFEFEPENEQELEREAEPDTAADWATELTSEEEVDAELELASGPYLDIETKTETETDTTGVELEVEADELSADIEIATGEAVPADQPDESIDEAPTGEPLLELTDAEAHDAVFDFGDLPADGNISIGEATTPTHKEEAASIDATPDHEAAYTAEPDVTTEAVERDMIRVGSTEISRPLYDLYLGEATHHLSVLHDQLGRMQSNPTLIPDERSLRAAHTLAGISGTTRIMPLHGLARALEYALERLRDADEAPSPEQADLLKTCNDTLEAMLGEVGKQQVPLEVPELIALLENVGRAPADEEPAAIPEQDEDAIPQAMEPKAAEPKAPPVLDDLDAQLLPIFIEEGSELVSELHSALRNWRADGSNEHAKSVARLLHTLKGSARMAGAMTLGNHVHQLESSLDAAGEAGNAPGEIVDELVTGLDLVDQMMAALTHPAATPAAAPAQDEGIAAASEAVAVASEAEPAGASATLRVRADTIDRFVNEAGEIGIARTRVAGELRTLRRSLLDLTENVIRLRNQLREVEIQADMQMQSRIAHSGSSDEDFDPLEMDRYTRLQELTRMMAESVGDVTTVQQSLLRNLDGADLALNSQARLARDLQQALMQVRMVPFESLADRLYRVVRQSAKDLGKRAALDLVGGRIEIDRSVLEHMTAPLEHLLRNAVAHGIESADMRRNKGKSEIGQITLSVSQEGNEIAIVLTDDGGGLDYARIAERARANGLLGPDEVADERRLTNLIFIPGFTTAGNLSTVSGRGVGMDVVKAETAAVGGRIDIHARHGEGTEFRIYLPLTLAVTQALLVTAAGRTYAIPSSMIAQVLELKTDPLNQLCKDGGTEWQGEHFAYRYLPQLLGDNTSRPEIQRFNWVLLLRAGAQTVALHVDALRGNQEIVVKSAGPQLARIVGVSGATVLGDGEIVLILNPVALASRSLASTEAGGEAIVPQAPAPAAPPSQPTVMVVDDSLTVRKITGRLLEREGYRVVTAKDGVEALERLIESVPDVILSDIEMPRMDGFDLLRNIRADDHTRDVPVIMITSRLGDKHRLRAEEIGASHYLGKPYEESELLELLRRYTAKSRAAAEI